MKCPHCEKTLVMTERTGIEIDYCPECRGVWLDRGELDKILERTRTEVAPRPTEDYNRPAHSYPDHGDYRKGYKRKKSFFEELFD